MKPPFVFLLFPPLFFSLSSCATTVDIERKVQSSLGVGSHFDPALAITGVPIEVETVPPPPVVIERPIYIPEASPASPAPPQGRGAVQAAARAGVLEPRDYSNAAMLYDYDRDFVYELYCQPFRLSDVTLQPGEKAVDVPFVSDSERWMLGAGVSYEGGVAVQHIYVKPTASNLTATLIINTDQRVYHLILRSYSDVHMPIVRWRYRENSIPQIYVGGNPGLPPGDGGGTGFSVDSRFLSFNYRITYGFFQKPKWLPTLVYDDGQKTYVTFPDLVLQTELPAVFEDRADILNYRVHGSLMVIDKLIEKITVRLADRAVTIEKKRG